MASWLAIERDWQMRSSEGISGNGFPYPIVPCHIIAYLLTVRRFVHRLSS